MATALVGLAVAAACGPNGQPDADRADTAADTADPALVGPGTVLRSGPATPEQVAGPVYPPVVRGDQGQVSIYQGYFVQAPCSRRLRAEAAHAGDTILARLVSEPDTLRTDACREPDRALGYALLVGPFEPGRYAVRLVHDGDRARPAPLDTVYDDITVKPER